MLRIDQLQVERREKPEGTQEAAVVAGKYILDGVYLEVEKGAEATRDKASLQVEITPNITVGTQVGVDSEGGLGYRQISVFRIRKNRYSAMMIRG